METYDDRVDRVTRWAAAFRVLEKNGLSGTVHAAGVLQFLDDDDIAPEIRVGDVEWMLRAVAVLYGMRERLAKAKADVLEESHGDALDPYDRGYVNGIRAALTALDETLKEARR